mmetsp:Transcript_24645/g.36295  ORF Transcript_24645/g.36295 Transcript_24645/m.36295 type:complete len:297 (-) Transcript_24645:1197-2087(-)
MAVALKCRDYRPGFIADVYNGLDPDAYQPPISKWLEAVQNQKKADFKLVSLTRLIYMNRPGLEQLQSIVMDTMRCCSFWPSNIPHRNRIRKSEFWSENHSFLYLSSAYLYRQQALKLGKDSGFVGKREVELLQCYLRGHCTQCPGVYEVLSVTYLPFTMCALLNLFDFSDDEAVRSAADILLNIITRQFLRVADADGSCHLSASCRVPHVEYLYKHSAFFNIHALLYFLELRDEAPNQSIFADFLSLTTWAPNIDVLNEFNMVGFHSEKVNHAFKHVSRVYTFDTLSPVEATPFYW